ncbi:MAG: hypothetical protein PHG66_01310 [Candidatus Colwellbacteria bacterium]|nr:hypothetical protein [Candidatus Colwellbacteria bacterium]
MFRKIIVALFLTLIVSLQTGQVNAKIVQPGELCDKSATITDGLDLSATSKAYCSGGCTGSYVPYNSTIYGTCQAVDCAITGCPSNLPICDSTTKTCKAGCQSDRDCTQDAAKDYCDPTTHQCVSRSSNTIGNFTTDECAIASDHFSAGLQDFISNNVMWGAAFWGIDTVVSLLENASVFGFQVGGALEPIDQTIDFFRAHWLTALTWSTISTVANWIAGGLIYSAIQMNLDLTTNNPLVSYGSGIIVGLVNLGFVIALIVIGIATILRRESYGLKKTFWRLLVAVAMVNFTLVLAGLVMNIGTAITKSFYEAANPCPGLITNRFAAPSIYRDLKSFMSLSTISGNTDSPVDVVDLTDEQAAKDLVTSKSSNASGFVQQLKEMIAGVALDYVALIATALISTIAAATYLAVGIFLIIRYVILMILLTFAPLIWIGFIFPKLKFPGLGDNVWDYWWEQFLKWVFYGPAMLIFLALASVFLSAMATAGNTNPNDVLKPIAQIIAVIIISAGGLFAANKFSGVAGGLVMAGASKGFGLLSTGVQNLGKMSLRGQMRAEQQAAEARARGESGASAARRAQLLGSFGKSLQMPTAGTGAVFKQVGLKVPTAKPMTKQEVRAEDVKTAEEKYKNYSTEELVDALHEMDRVNIGSVENPLLHRAQRIAVMKKLADGGNLDKIRDVNYVLGRGVRVNAVDRAVSAGTRTTFGAAGQKFGDVEKGLGMSVAMREAGRKYEAISATAAAELANSGSVSAGTAAIRAAAETDLKARSEEWTKTLSPDDLKKLPVDNIYGKFDPETSIARTPELHDALRESVTEGVLMNNHTQYAKLLNVKSGNFRDAATSVKKTAERLKAGATSRKAVLEAFMGPLTASDAAELAKVTLIESNMQSVIDNVEKTARARSMVV